MLLFTYKAVTFYNMQQKHTGPQYYTAEAHRFFLFHNTQLHTIFFLHVLVRPLFPTSLAYLHTK